MTEKDRDLIERLHAPLWWQALVGPSESDSLWRDSYAPKAAAQRIKELHAENELVELEERQRIIDYLKRQALYFEQLLKDTPYRYDNLRSEYALHRKSCIASAKAIEIGEHLK